MHTKIVSKNLIVTLATMGILISGPEIISVQIIQPCFADTIPEQTQQDRDKKIENLKQVINGNPETAGVEVLLELIELYHESAYFYEDKAYSQDQENQEDLNIARELRNQAIKLYVGIYRDYADYKKMDKILFDLGQSLQEIGKTDRAMQIYKKLIKMYPTNEYMQDVLYAFGEYYFEKGEMENAKKAYNKIIANYKDFKVYPYAIYKTSWCYYNLADYQMSLKLLGDVINYTKDKEDKNLKQLRKEVLKDYPMSYEHFGSPSKAIKHFKNIAPEKNEHMTMIFRLAKLYANNGKFKESTFVYKALIKENKDSFIIVSYQFEIAMNTSYTGYKKNNVKEIMRLIKLYGICKTFEDALPNDVEIMGTKIEKLSLETVINYYNEAQSTKNNEIYVLIIELIKDHMQEFSDSKEIYTLTFYYAEVLYRIAIIDRDLSKAAQKFQMAAENYQKVIDMNPEGKWKEDAIIGVERAREKGGLK